MKRSLMIILLVALVFCFVQTSMAINKQECEERSATLQKGAVKEDTKIVVKPYVQPYRGPQEVLWHWDFETAPEPGEFRGIDGTDVGVMWHTQNTYNVHSGKNWWCGKEGLDLNGLPGWGYGDWWYQTLDTHEI